MIYISKKLVSFNVPVSLPALYVKERKDSLLFVAVYLNYLIFIGYNEELNKLKGEMTPEFEMTDLGLELLFWA